MSVAAGGGASVAAAAAAARAAMLRKEEEQMTPYNAEDLNGWEFKIVRANSRKFKSAEAVRKLCAEEAPAGWEMVEKFDDSRVRFKRRSGLRSKDQYLPPGSIDPYRTLVGASETRLVLIIVGASLALGAGIAIAAWLLG